MMLLDDLSTLADDLQEERLAHLEEKLDILLSGSLYIRLRAVLPAGILTGFSGRAMPHDNKNTHSKMSPSRRKSHTRPRRRAPS